MMMEKTEEPTTASPQFENEVPGNTPYGRPVSNVLAKIQNVVNQELVDKASRLEHVVRKNHGIRPPSHSGWEFIDRVVAKLRETVSLVLFLQ